MSLRSPEFEDVRGQNRAMNER